MRRKKPNTGYVRMVELGAKPVRIWLDPAEMIAVKRAAKEARLPLATFVRVVAYWVASNGRFKATAHGVRDTGYSP